MSAFLSPLGGAGWQFFNDQGNVLAGGQLFTYLAGTTTPVATYTDSTQATANPNPIILNAEGRTPQEVWLTSGTKYKFIVQDASNVTVTPGTWDNISGINDASVSNTEWLSSGLTPTFVSTTSFTLPGNQTAIFNKYRRVQATVSAGTVYGNVLSAVYNGSSLTTITLVMDFGQVLDSGLSSVQYNIVSLLTAGGVSYTYPASAGVSTSLLTKFQNEVVSVKDFGAKGDGTTDDAAAFQAAINSGANRIHVPAGNYIIKTVLNFTNRSSQPLVIFGDGSYFQSTGGTCLTFRTGSWMADMTGCQFLHLEHMRWVSNGGDTNFSTMGCLYARSATVNFAIFNTMFKMIIELPSSSGSSVGSIALADNCVENCIFDECWFVADCPYASTLANELTFVSTYTTVANTNFSNTDKTFRQCIFQARNNFANVFYGVGDSTFDQCNWTLLGSLGAGVLAAIIFNASAQAYQVNANIRFTGDFESFPSIAYLASNTRNLLFDCTTAGTTYSFIQPFTATVHDNFELKVAQLSGSQTNLVLSTGGGVIMNNAKITMGSGQTLLDGNLQLRGGIVFGGVNDLSNTGVLSVNAASSFGATYINSKLTGSVAWNPGGISNGGTVSTTLTVTNAVGGTSIRVLAPYPLQGCMVTASVSASNTVQIAVSNTTGGTVTLGNGTWVVEVNKIYSF